MESIKLVRPDAGKKAAAEEYIQEHRAAGEPVLMGAAMLEKMPTYEDWLARLELLQTPEGAATVGLVDASTFFAVRQSDGRIVGTVDVRHRLNDFLLANAGHIGYGVRPAERRKGYAEEMLRQALAYCQNTLGLEKVLLVCDVVNEGSRRTILKNGGVLENEAVHPDGKPIQRYWIDLGRRGS